MEYQNAIIVPIELYIASYLNNFDMAEYKRGDLSIIEILIDTIIIVPDKHSIIAIINKEDKTKAAVEENLGDFSLKGLDFKEIIEVKLQPLIYKLLKKAINALKTNEFDHSSINVVNIRDN